MPGGIVESRVLIFRASYGSFEMLVILLGHRRHHRCRRRLPVGPFSDGMIAVGCSHLGFWQVCQWLLGFRGFTGFI